MDYSGTASCRSRACRERDYKQSSRPVCRSLVRGFYKAFSSAGICRRDPITRIPIPRLRTRVNFIGPVGTASW